MRWNSTKIVLETRLDMIMVSSEKAAMCTETKMDWNMADSDHSGVKIWLNIQYMGGDVAYK